MPNSISAQARRSFTRAASVLAITAASLAPSAPASASEPPPKPPAPTGASSGSTGSASSDTARAFTPSPTLDLRSLEDLVAKRAATVEGAALDVDLAAADVQQSRLLPNPSLDASWSTIPVGETNPPDLKAPLANVPNYGVGLSYTFLLGKRGPATERALALQRAAKASLGAATRERAIDLARLLGELATYTLRLTGLRAVVDSGKRSVALAEERLASSFGTPLDLDRLRIDVSRTEQQVLSGESDQAAALAACAAVVGMPCRSFASEADAKAFLTTFIARSQGAAGSIEDRPDIRALDAYRSAASSEAALARARAIPDPTVRVGYVHDRFIASGAQQNSFNLSLSLPLPIFDRGQALSAAAEAKRARLGRERTKAIEASKARIPALVARLDAQRARQEALTTSIMPRALAVLSDVERAAGNRLLSLADVIQARRTVAELLVEQADSFSDAFEAALEIAAELPTPPARPGAPDKTQDPAKEPTK